jgi:chaperonin cofactor prefoldin
MKTDWKEDILAPSMQGKRRYHVYENEDASISLIDSTQYDQVGDVFGANELNQIGLEINSTVEMLTSAVQIAQESAESAQESAERAMQYTPEGYAQFVSSTEEHLSTLDANYATLDERVDTAESNISSNTTRITNIETKLSMITATLSAGSISVTLTDERITTDSVFRFYTSKFGVSPTGCTVNNGSVILTFEAQSEPIVVGVKVE